MSFDKKVVLTCNTSRGPQLWGFSHHGMPITLRTGIVNYPGLVLCRLDNTPVHSGRVTWKNSWSLGSSASRSSDTWDITGIFPWIRGYVMIFHDISYMVFHDISWCVMACNITSKPLFIKDLNCGSSRWGAMGSQDCCPKTPPQSKWSMHACWLEYPLVNIQKTMDHHHFYWVNQLSMGNFH